MAEHVFQEFVQELQCPLWYEQCTVQDAMHSHATVTSCTAIHTSPSIADTYSASTLHQRHVAQLDTPLPRDCVVSCLEGPGIIESRCPFPGSPKPCGLPLPRKDLRPHHKIQALVQHIHALCKQGVLPSSLLPPSQPAPPDNTAAPAHHTDASPKADSSDESTNPGLSDIARQVARNLPTSPCALRAVSSQLQAGLARCESLLASRATPAAQLVPESLPVHEMYHLDSLDDALRQRGYLYVAGEGSHLSTNATSTGCRPSRAPPHTAPRTAPLLSSPRQRTPPPQPPPGSFQPRLPLVALRHRPRRQRGAEEPRGQGAKGV